MNTRIKVTIVTFVADSVAEGLVGAPQQGVCDAATGRWSELLRCKQVVRFLLLAAV